MNFSKLLEEPNRISLVVLNFVKLILTIVISNSLFHIADGMNIESLQGLINSIRFDELLTPIILIVVVWFLIWEVFSFFFFLILNIIPTFKKNSFKSSYIYSYLKSAGAFKEPIENKIIPTKKTSLFEEAFESKNLKFSNRNIVKYLYLFLVIYVFYLFNPCLLFGYSKPILITIGILLLLGILITFFFQQMFSFIDDNTHEFRDFTFRLKYSRIIKEVFEGVYSLKLNDDFNYSFNKNKTEYHFFEFATENQLQGAKLLETLVDSLKSNTIIITNINPSEKLIELINKKEISGIITAKDKKEIEENLLLFF